MAPSHSSERFAWRIKLRTCGVGMGFLLGCCIPARTQESVSPRTDPPLILTGTIALPNVDGRIAQTAGYAANICKRGRDRFHLGVPARPGHNSAEVWIYQAKD